MVQDICTDLDRVKGRAAMKTLKDLTVERPPLRDEGLRLLLELCTHPGEPCWLGRLSQSSLTY